MEKDTKTWRPLTNLQINEALENRGVDNYRGTYSKDTLPNKPKANESLVINLEDCFDGDGTHWVAIYNDPLTRDVEYLDTFGMRPLEGVYQYMQKTGKGIVYDFRACYKI